MTRDLNQHNDLIFAKDIIETTNIRKRKEEKKGWDAEISCTRGVRPY